MQLTVAPFGPCRPGEPGMPWGPLDPGNPGTPAGPGSPCHEMEKIMIHVFHYFFSTRMGNHFKKYWNTEVCDTFKT